MYSLNEILANHSWLRCTKPYPHVVARNVFVPGFYQALAGQLNGILARGLAETMDRGRYSRSIKGYDSYAIGFGRGTTGPVSVFLSKEWRDMIAWLFGVGPTSYVFVGSHHHAVGSANGFIHNDFNPVWFPHANGTDTQTPQNEVCAFKTGAGPLAASDKIQLVRAVAVLFYVLNDGWRRGDGGETAMYTSARSLVSEPLLCCPPISNSMLAFECSPNSHHAFLSNRRERTSVVMWIHRTVTEADQKFGIQNLEKWKD